MPFPLPTAAGQIYSDPVLGDYTSVSRGAIFVWDKDPDATLNIDLHDKVANMAAIPPSSGNPDGYKVSVDTNLLTYEIVDGNFELVSNAINVQNLIQFSGISEPQTNQQVYIQEVDKEYLWDGASWHEIRKSVGSPVISSSGGSSFTPQTGWVDPANDLTDKVLDANSFTQQELADYVSTIVVGLKNAGIFTN